MKAFFGGTIRFCALSKLAKRYSVGETLQREYSASSSLKQGSSAEPSTDESNPLKFPQSSPKALIISHFGRATQLRCSSVHREPSGGLLLFSVYRGIPKRRKTTLKNKKIPFRQVSCSYLRGRERTYFH